MSNKTSRSLLDTLFRDKNGKLVIGQSPNLPIAGWFVFTILAMILRHNQLHDGLHALAQAFLFVWAYLEIRSGDSLFRRILGGIVMTMVLVGFFS